MNSILELKGKRFEQESRRGGGGGASMNSKVVVTTTHINRLISQLKDIQTFWGDEERAFTGVLISVHYNKIVAKSNRISGLFKGTESNTCVVGAKFDDSKSKHIITYYISSQDIDTSIQLLNDARDMLETHFHGQMNKTCHEDRDHSHFPAAYFTNKSFSKSIFKRIIADVSYIESFQVDIPKLEDTSSIITLYNVGIDTQVLLQHIGINIMRSRILDHRSVYLDANQLQVLSQKMPYLVAMSTIDLSTLTVDSNQSEYETSDALIFAPTIEPTIGVIDTLFDERVYFSNWVEYHEMVSKDIPRDANDYKHGTAVSSIIVDGPRMNPWLDDHCGHFKVRHFGVAVGQQFSSFSIIKQIKSIIADNLDIKVWNISLGSNQEINDNFISAEAAVLDQIQFEYDVIFVIAGTNRSSESIIKIGSPADSINGIVVNAVTKFGVSTQYSRCGLALSFFAKPDVSYYGGSSEQYMKVCEPLGPVLVGGTSYAAPWIARKLSYLIDIVGLRREVAKALIIDAAKGWNKAPTADEIAWYGHGIVPIDINEILQSKDDEIKFLISDVSEKWNTYNYEFPVPMDSNEYPYIARATMCYFPMCNRSQGVDYTNTELNLHFGRINDKGKIIAINDDKQNTEQTGRLRYLLEEEARKQFRKWDNVKYITERSDKRFESKKSYTNKNWGMEIKTSNRLDPRDGFGVRFGVVVTLKEINGVNRIDEFIRNCNLRGWIVNRLDVENRIDIHKKINEEIELL